MAHRTHVPPFGKWEGGDNVPYTVYFEKARKGRGGKMINPNDPEENSDALPLDSVPPAQVQADLEGAQGMPPARVQADLEGAQGHKHGHGHGHGHGPVRPTHERKLSSESDLKQFAAESPSRAANGTKHQAHGGRGAGSGSGDQPQKRVVRGSAGSDHSVDRSPIHYQARTPGRGSASPSWEGRAARDGSHGTPGRSRLGADPRKDDLPDKGSTVPKFGEWDEKDPASAEGYTGIFNKVREEKQTGARNGSEYIQSPYRPSNGAKKAPTSGSKICCFPWGRK